MLTMGTPICCSSPGRFRMLAFRACIRRGAVDYEIYSLVCEFYCAAHSKDRFAVELNREDLGSCRDGAFYPALFDLRSQGHYLREFSFLSSSCRNFLAFLFSLQKYARSPWPFGCHVGEVLEPLRERRKPCLAVGCLDRFDKPSVGERIHSDVDFTYYSHKGFSLA